MALMHADIYPTRLYRSTLTLLSLPLSTPNLEGAFLMNNFNGSIQQMYLDTLTETMEQHQQQIRESSIENPQMTLTMMHQPGKTPPFNFIAASSSALNRTKTGHARFRRTPIQPPTASLLPPSSSPQILDFSSKARVEPADYLSLRLSQPLSCSTTTTNSSSITAEGSVSNYGIMKPPLPPPLSASRMKTCHCHRHSSSSSFTRSCRCTKRIKKCRVKKMIRVPAISSKVADIPADEYSWRKYGQKPIKGSPFPRGYYKCSSVRGCPARKHVERANDDPTMLIVTYGGEHNHGSKVEVVASLASNSDGAAP